MMRILSILILVVSVYASADIKIDKVGLNLGLYNMDYKDSDNLYRRLEIDFN